MSYLSEVYAVVKQISLAHVLAAYAALKVYVAAVRAKVAKAADEAKAVAYIESKKAEAAANAVEVKVKSYLSYWYAEIKKAI